MSDQMGGRGLGMDWSRLAGSRIDWGGLAEDLVDWVKLEGLRVDWVKTEGLGADWVKTGLGVAREVVGIFGVDCEKTGLVVD